MTIVAAVDINPNTLNTKSNGNPVTAYIELPEGYDVGQIDVATVKLAAGGAEIAAELSPTSVGDYDGDGIADLMVKFDRQALITALAGQSGDVALTINGQLTSGATFTGVDRVRAMAK